MTAVVVDDDPDATRLLASMLEGQANGCRILKAYDGNQALQIMSESVPDLVLMDVIMPGLDGVEILARMRATSA